MPRETDHTAINSVLINDLETIMNRLNDIMLRADNVP